MKHAPSKSKSRLNITKKTIGKRNNVFSFANLAAALENTGAVTKAKTKKAPKITIMKVTSSLKKSFADEHPIEQLEKLADALRDIRKKEAAKIAVPLYKRIVEHEPALRVFFIGDADILENAFDGDEATEDPKEYLRDVAELCDSLAEMYDSLDEEEKVEAAKAAYLILLDVFDVVKPIKGEKTFRMNALMSALMNLS